MTMRCKHVSVYRGKRRWLSFLLPFPRRPPSDAKKAKCWVRPSATDLSCWNNQI